MPIGPFGHVYSWQAVDAYLSETDRPCFGAAAAPLRDSGAGKTIVLSDIVRKVVGQDLIHLQTIGDCVSHGWGLAIDFVKAIQINQGSGEQFIAETATEAIYALDRVEVGRGQLGNGDGAVGAWAAQAVKDYGTLLRQPYGSIDLTTYSGARAREWGKRGNGLPDALEPEAKEHPIRTASLVTTYEEARDAIANGFPVPVCSNQGFSETRDADGFARASGSWSHCMCFIGIDDTATRPALLCMNSWGPDWISGPKRLNQPEGSFWVDAKIANNMLRKNPDSFAISSFVGFPAQSLFDQI